MHTLHKKIIMRRYVSLPSGSAASKRRGHFAPCPGGPMSGLRYSQRPRPLSRSILNFTFCIFNCTGPPPSPSPTARKLSSFRQLSILRSKFISIPQIILHFEFLILNWPRLPTAAICQTCPRSCSFSSRNVFMAGRTA